MYDTVTTHPTVESVARESTGFNDTTIVALHGMWERISVSAWVVTDLVNITQHSHKGRFIPLALWPAQLSLLLCNTVLSSERLDYLGIRLLLHVFSRGNLFRRYFVNCLVEWRLLSRLSLSGKRRRRPVCTMTLYSGPGLTDTHESQYCYSIYLWAFLSLHWFILTPVLDTLLCTCGRCCYCIR